MESMIASNASTAASSTTTTTKTTGRRQALLAISALLLNAPPRPALAQARLRIALIELLPWAATDASGRQCGIMVDAVRCLSMLSGIAMEITPLPYPRALKMLETGQVDLMIALEAPRLNDIAFKLAPLAIDDVVLAGRPGLAFNSIADLGGKVVGRLRDADYDASFATASHIIKYETNSYRQSLQMMRAGRLDAVIFVRTALRYTLKFLGMGNESLGTVIELRHAPLTLYAGRRLGDAAALSALKQAADVLYKNQTVKTLAERLLAS